MYISKMALPRRTFLRGLGITIALPLLDAMMPAMSVFAKSAARPVKRLGFIYTPNGATMSAWTGAPASTACHTGWMPSASDMPSRCRNLRLASMRIRFTTGFAALVTTSLTRPG